MEKKVHCDNLQRKFFAGFLKYFTILYKKIYFLVLLLYKKITRSIKICDRISLGKHEHDKACLTFYVHKMFSSWRLYYRLPFQEKLCPSTICCYLCLYKHLSNANHVKKFEYN